MVDELQGLLNQFQASLFIVYISQGSQEQIDAYNSKFLVSDSFQLFTALRFLVQDYFMGGVLTTADIDSWIFGIPNSFIDIMSTGEYLEGADFDLISTVYPIYNTPLDSLIYDTKIRMDAGFDEQELIARVRLVNNLPTINKNQYVFNGTDPSLL
mmetsp:Transcript_9644/g.9315  ORF Transcript_9644/g.9315 Transcript_9644/m.9315 type:complete len:155 (+) Transcript_9644:1138-1602(+)